MKKTIILILIIVCTLFLAGCIENITDKTTKEDSTNKSIEPDVKITSASRKKTHTDSETVNIELYNEGGEGKYKIKAIKLSTEVGGGYVTCDTTEVFYIDKEATKSMEWIVYTGEGGTEPTIEKLKVLCRKIGETSYTVTDEYEF